MIAFNYFRPWYQHTTVRKEVRVRIGLLKIAAKTRLAILKIRCWYFWQRIKEVL